MIKIELPIKTGFYLGWAGVAFVLFLIELPYFKFPFSANEGMFSCVAQQMRLGAKLYQDVWDHKPPLLFLHFVLIQSLFGTGELPLRIYTVFIHFIDSVLLYWLVLRLGFNQKAAWFTVGTYVVLLFPPFFQGWTPQAEVLMQPFLLGALIAATYEKERAWFLAGVLWSLSFFTKPTALFLIPVFWFLCGKEKLKSAGFFILGADLIAFSVISPFMLNGRFPLVAGALWGFNRDYVHQGWESFFHHPDYQKYVLGWHGRMLLVFGLPLLLTIGSLLRNIRVLAETPSSISIWVWLVLSFVSCLASGYFYPYYYFILIPPLAVLVGFFLRSDRPKRNWFLSIAFVLGIAALVWPWFWVYRQGLDGLKDSDYFTDRSSESKEVGLYLKSISQASDRVMVWSTEPQIYVYSGLKMEGITTPLVNHLRSMPGEWNRAQREFEVDFPKYVVISDFNQLMSPPDWLLKDISEKYLKLESQDSWNHYSLYVFKYRS